MGIIPIIKHAVNSTLGTGFFMPLDKLLGAKIACRGTMGTKFKLTRTDGYFAEKTAEITEASRPLGDGLYVEIVPVPVGNYSIEINAVGIIMTASVAASVIGEIYTFSYSSYQEIARFTSNGTFTVPDGVTEIFVDAIGGGGGGGGKGDIDSSGSRYGNGGGGGGGGGGRYVNKKRFEVLGGQSIDITIGTGGEGGRQLNNGVNGTATIVGSLVTASGGNGGNKGKDSSAGGYGGVGGSGGASGGSGGSASSTSGGKSGNGSKGSDCTLGGKGGAGGTGTTGSYYSNGAGGGGGGGFGNGGAGSADYGKDGGIGAGGGGGYAGGKGGNGIVIIYKGISV